MEVSCSLKLSSSLSPFIINIQGSSSSIDVKFSNNISLPKLNDRSQRRLRNQQPLHPLNIRSYRKRVTAKSGSQGWDFGRFLKTLYFFNGAPSPLKFVASVFEKLTNESTEESVSAMETSGIILVAGATGGVGRRVVDILRNRGLPVKALVRNEEKARKMLGPDIDLVRNSTGSFHIFLLLGVSTGTKWKIDFTGDQSKRPSSIVGFHRFLRLHIEGTSRNSSH